MACFVTAALWADTAVLHLKNGDRIAGEVVSESAEAIVVNTSWAKGLSIPLDQLERKEILPSNLQTNAPVLATVNPTNAANSDSAGKVATTAKPVEPKKAKEWKFDAKLGADMIRGEKDRDIFYGQLALTYARPYEANPKKFFRNQLDYRADYSTTDGVESANRMFGANKTDVDFAKYAYAYNYFGAGFDEVRKIENQIEAGPGVGYHLLRKPAFVVNVEGGLTYQLQDRQDAPELNEFYARVGQDITWKVYPKITLTQRSSLLASLDELDQLQFRFEANISFGIVQNLSLNFAAVELYDTRPVPGVSENEFQLRSALGISF